MTKKIFRSILLVAAAVLLLSLISIVGVIYNHFTEVQKERLQDEASFAVQGVELIGEEYLTGLSSEEYRITWVATDGGVLFDTKVDLGRMDNHSDREEIREAFEKGSGESSRYSNTLMEKTLYYARRLSDGTVLRVSFSLASVFALLLRVLAPVATVFLLAVIISVLLARRMAKRIVGPLNDLNLDAPLENDVYEELSPILGKLNKQRKQIAEQMALLKRKNDEFEQIITSLNEGLVLLDENRMVISMNQAAKKLFGVYNQYVGSDFFTIDRSAEMNRAIEKAFSGKHSQFRLQKNGGEYQFDVSCIEFDGKVLGVVIYVFDVTEQVFAERNRQEFTANVSHELKTPLQSIIGSAELMENGLVKPGDMPRFVGHIRSEAARLVTLINDIIRLSQMDEDVEMPTENVELREVTEEIFEVLKPSADQKGVSLSLSGTAVTMSGIKSYIYEIIYNLCDNAIRYNKEGGKVTVAIERELNNIVLKVTDTGIGIATEHHSRIFERFYRVDKSHSKETGGTGLGLSIVKHAVQYHGGQLKLESVPGEGTVVTVVF